MLHEFIIKKRRFSCADFRRVQRIANDKRAKQAIYWISKTGGKKKPIDSREGTQFWKK